MSIRGGRAAALLSMGLCASVAQAQSTPPHIELRWNAPAECPDDLSVLHAIEAFLGQPLSQAREQQVRIEARVLGEAAHGYAGKLLFSTPEGTSERGLEHPDCAKLTEGLALLSALAIDPERVRAKQQAAATGGKDKPEPEIEPAPAALPEPLSDHAAPALPSDRRPPLARADGPEAGQPQVGIGVLGLAAAGLLPSSAPGLSAELGLSFGPFEAALGGRYWVSRSATIPDVPDASVDVSLVTAGLRLCGVPRLGPWFLLACARGDVGDMSGQGEGVDNARTRHDPFADLGGSLAVAYKLGRFRPLVGAELLWLASRPRFGVLRDGMPIQAFRPRTWQLGGFMGFSYAL